MIRNSEALGSAPERDLYELVEGFFRSTFATDNALITEAVRRMLRAGGKRLRPRFTLLAAESNGADPRTHLPLAAYMELIHVGTLIHDDVVDRADVRRGVNATAVDYGNRISVLAGDYLFAWIFKNVTASYAPPIPNILSATLADITDGEVLQLRSLGNLALTLEQYVEIVAKKTAALFAASCECGALAAGAAPIRVAALRDFGHFYGIAFQMFDDLLDVTASAAELGKPAGNDLRERKTTIPVLFALARGTSGWRTALEQYYAGEPDEAAIPELLAGIAASGALGATRDAIADYAERAKRALAPLGTNPARAELCALADALVRDAAARTRSYVTDGEV
ncbi:MAG: polyprenyl synthetase family protein [Candidatus Eremiobacteraeota bacterium]|nr:polyprenyl synthetase family protein [Candidatus Eremiobacteraeota bacterium]